MESNPGTGYLCHLGIHPIFPGDHCLPNSLDFDERPSVNLASRLSQGLSAHPVNDSKGPEKEPEEQQETFQKECVRQHIDNGIRAWIKNPILISKQNLMKRDKDLFKINEH